MTMADRPNRNALNQALDVYRDAMRVFIISWFDRNYRGQAEDAIRNVLTGRRHEEFNRRLHQNDYDVESTIDIDHFPILMNKYRNSIFGRRHNYKAVEDKLWGIVYARNMAAHPGRLDIEPKYADTSMSYIADILGLLNETEAVRAFGAIRSRLISCSSGRGRAPETPSVPKPAQPPRKPRPPATLDGHAAFDIDGLMESLSRKRPIFRSEADFQHSIESLIHETTPDRPVHLMHQLPHEEQNRYLDIWLPADGIAIQLRLATQKLEPVWDDVSFELKEHSAQDLTRYDLLRDIQRLEHTVALSDVCKSGLAILLTNDPLFWKTPYRAGTIDAAFRIHEGRELRGELAWADHAGAGSTRGREAPIRLEGSYTVHWQDYSNFADEKYGKFRYLAVEVR